MKFLKERQFDVSHHDNGKNLNHEATVLEVKRFVLLAPPSECGRAPSKSVSNFRIQAVSATFAVLPAARSRS